MENIQNITSSNNKNNQENLKYVDEFKMICQNMFKTFLDNNLCTIVDDVYKKFSDKINIDTIDSSNLTALTKKEINSNIESYVNDAIKSRVEGNIQKDDEMNAISKASGIKKNLPMNNSSDVEYEKKEEENKNENENTNLLKKKKLRDVQKFEENRDLSKYDIKETSKKNKKEKINDEKNLIKNLLSPNSPKSQEDKYSKKIKLEESIPDLKEDSKKDKPLSNYEKNVKIKKKNNDREKIENNFLLDNEEEFVIKYLKEKIKNDQPIRILFELCQKNKYHIPEVIINIIGKNDQFSVKIFISDFYFYGDGLAQSKKEGKKLAAYDMIDKLLNFKESRTQLINSLCEIFKIDKFKLINQKEHFMNTLSEKDIQNNPSIDAMDVIDLNLNIVELEKIFENLKYEYKLSSHVSRFHKYIDEKKYYIVKIKINDELVHEEKGTKEGQTYKKALKEVIKSIKNKNLKMTEQIQMKQDNLLIKNEFSDNQHLNQNDNKNILISQNSIDYSNNNNILKKNVNILVKNPQESNMSIPNLQILYSNSNPENKKRKLQLNNKDEVLLNSNHGSNISSNKNFDNKLNNINNANFYPNFNSFNNSNFIPDNYDPMKNFNNIENYNNFNQNLGINQNYPQNLENNLTNQNSHTFNFPYNNQIPNVDLQHGNLNYNPLCLPENLPFQQQNINQNLFSNPLLNITNNNPIQNLPNIKQIQDSVNNQKFASNTLMNTFLNNYDSNNLINNLNKLKNSKKSSTLNKTQFSSINPNQKNLLNPNNQEFNNFENKRVENQMNLNEKDFNMDSKDDNKFCQKYELSYEKIDRSISNTEIKDYSNNASNSNESSIKINTNSIKNKEKNESMKKSNKFIKEKENSIDKDEKLKEGDSMNENLVLKIEKNTQKQDKKNKEKTKRITENSEELIDLKSILIKELNQDNIKDGETESKENKLEWKSTQMDDKSIQNSTKNEKKIENFESHNKESLLSGKKENKELSNKSINQFNIEDLNKTKIDNKIHNKVKKNKQLPKITNNFFSNIPSNPIKVKTKKYDKEMEKINLNWKSNLGSLEKEKELDEESMKYSENVKENSNSSDIQEENENSDEENSFSSKDDNEVNQPESKENKKSYDFMKSPTHSTKSTKKNETAYDFYNSPKSSYSTNYPKKSKIEEKIDDKLKDLEKEKKELLIERKKVKALIQNSKDHKTTQIEQKLNFIYDFSMREKLINCSDNQIDKEINVVGKVIDQIKEHIGDNLQRNFEIFCLRLERAVEAKSFFYVEFINEYMNILINLTEKLNVNYSFLGSFYLNILRKNELNIDVLLGDNKVDMKSIDIMLFIKNDFRSFFTNLFPNKQSNISVTNENQKTKIKISIVNNPLTMTLYFINSGAEYYEDLFDYKKFLIENDENITGSHFCISATLLRLWRRNFKLNFIPVEFLDFLIVNYKSELISDTVILMRKFLV